MDDSLRGGGGSTAESGSVDGRRTRAGFRRLFRSRSVLLLVAFLAGACKSIEIKIKIFLQNSTIFNFVSQK